MCFQSIAPNFSGSSSASETVFQNSPLHNFLFLDYETNISQNKQFLKEAEEDDTVDELKSLQH